jgi:UDP-glucose 4-epimerase
MKVAVTGARGFIGTALCRRLSAEGHRVSALARSSEPLRLTDEAAVVHLAGLAHRKAAAPGELQHANVDLARQVGNAAASSGAHMIFVSSIKVHGEDCNEPLRETSPFNPQDEYAASKMRAEEALHAIAGLRLTVVRPPLVYGPGVKANFLALMQALVRGWPLPFASIANRRSFLYVENLADLILHCLGDSSSLGRTYLPCDGEPLSTPQLCRELGQALQRPARLFPFPPRALELLHGARRLTRSLYADAAALQRELAWRAPIARAEGLRETARWFSAR